MKILVVDDALLSQTMFKKFLTPLGYFVACFGNGQEALEEFQKEGYSLIITDLVMPKMDGYTLCRRIRSLPNGKYTVILAITAHHDPGTLQKVLDAGADDYLDKPDLMNPSDSRIFQIRLEIARKMALERQARKHAEDALYQSQERLELALKGADLGLWDWDIKTGKIIVNKRWAEMLGYSLDDLHPDTSLMIQLTHPDDRATATKTLEDHLAGKTTFYDLEVRYRTHSGEWKWILSRGKIVERDVLGAPIRMAGTNQDIDLKKQSEAEIKILQGYLPICSRCKKIRDDKGYWQQVEEYITANSEVEFTHSLCQECASELYPGLYKKDKKK